MASRVDVPFTAATAAHLRSVRLSPTALGLTRTSHTHVALELRTFPSAATRSSVIGQCFGALASAGLKAALSLLNQRTRFRFTGVYKADPPVLLNVGLFDRENPALMLAGGTTPLRVGHSFGGASLAPSASQSYAGAAIRMESGRQWGTLCHFDLRPRLLPATELEILHGAAALLARWFADQECENDARAGTSTCVDVMPAASGAGW